MPLRPPPPVPHYIDPTFVRWMKGLDTKRQTTQLLLRNSLNDTSSKADESAGSQSKSASPAAADAPTAEVSPPPPPPPPAAKEETTSAARKTKSPLNASNPAEAAAATAVHHPHHRVFTAEEIKARRQRDERHHKVSEALGKLRGNSPRRGERTDNTSSLSSSVTSPARQRTSARVAVPARVQSSPRVFSTSPARSSPPGRVGAASTTSGRKALTSTFPHELNNGAIPAAAGQAAAFPQPRSSAALRCYARGFQRVVVVPTAPKGK